MKNFVTWFKGASVIAGLAAIARLLYLHPYIYVVTAYGVLVLLGLFLLTAVPYVLGDFIEFVQGRGR
jgi:hypothetical protein